MTGHHRILLSLTLALIGLGLLVYVLGLPAETTQAAAELTVCKHNPACDFTTIQDAVDAALPGDVILIAADTYTGVHARNGITQMVYISKSVTLRGGYLDDFVDPPDPETNVTVLDAEGQGRVISVEGFSLPEGTPAVAGSNGSAITPTIEGLMITGGNATGLAGASSYWEDAGGGILISFADATIRNCVIYSNVASILYWGWGGGIFVDFGAATIEGNDITQNVAALGGMPIGYGGGLALDGGASTVVGNRIWGNTANGSPVPGEGTNALGGGVYSAYGTNLFVNNIIHDNLASAGGNGQGGGIATSDYDESTFINTVLYANTLGCFDPLQGDPCAGSAILSDWGARPTYLHTTLHDNCAGPDCSAVAIGYDGVITLTNTIVASETVGLRVGQLGWLVADGILWHNTPTQTVVMGTLDVKHAITGNPQLAADGYHLLPDSPAIDAGVVTTAPVDIDGTLRPVGVAPDLGADEALPTVVIGPGGGTLVYSDGLGSAISVTVPTSAVVEVATLTLTPLVTPTAPLPPGIYYGGIAFELDALCLRGTERAYLPLVVREAPGMSTTTSLSRLASLVDGGLSAFGSELVPCALFFQEPVTVTLHYSDEAVAGLDEDLLVLYYYTGTEWIDVATTCTPHSTYIRDPDLNQLTVAICHLTQFAIGSE